LYKLISGHKASQVAAIKNAQLAAASHPTALTGTSGVPLSTAGGTIQPYAPLGTIGLAQVDSTAGNFQVSVPISAGPSGGTMLGFV
jgi:hypothetical protein